jgi:hypothetical protein
MTSEKPSKKAINVLETQIKHDQEQPIRSAEKRVKFNVSFEKAMQIISRTKPKK